MYKHDVKELFQIEPVEVVRRVVFSFIPGKHTPLLASPDLYGPVVATCILPQVRSNGSCFMLLFLRFVLTSQILLRFGFSDILILVLQVMLVAMDSTHHGCSRSSLLGDAVVVSMCLWFGLAGLYRIFGVLVAPMLSAKHCLCLTGMSNLCRVTLSL